MPKANNSNDRQHGRDASSPQQIPARGWKDIGVRVSKEIKDDNIDVMSAGVAFFAFLSIFPAIATLIAIYGLVVDPQTVQQQLSQLANVLPEQSRQLLQKELGGIVRGSPTALGWGLVFSALLSLWSANSGMKALFKGINVAYDEHDNRNFFKQNAITLLFTFLGIVVVVISMALVVALPAAVGALGLPDAIQTAVGWGRWLFLGLLVMVYLAALYRFAPDRRTPRWTWVSWGSVIATILWVAASAGFSLYVSNFSNYNATYGSLAAVVILLFWFYLSSFMILLGAEINSELERQTRKDTTTGNEKPMGRRDASSADTLGEAA